jgi:hypothetical protein
MAQLEAWTWELEQECSEAARKQAQEKRSEFIFVSL